MSFGVPDNYYYPPGVRYPPGTDLRRTDMRPGAYGVGAIDYGWPIQGQPQYQEFLPPRQVATDILPRPVTQPSYLVGNGIQNTAVYETGPPEFAYPAIPRKAVKESKPKFTTTDMSEKELREFVSEFRNSPSAYTSRTIFGEEPTANDIYIAPSSTKNKQEPSKWRFSNVQKTSKEEVKEDVKKDVMRPTYVERVDPVVQPIYVPEIGRRYIQPQEPYYPPEPFGGYYQPGPEVAYGRQPPTGYYI